jgi:predicted nucleic acid-binding protein
MSTLVDTNILTRSIYKADPLHQLAVNALDGLRQKGEQLCIVPQNLYEFWVVCTRPTSQNGLGMIPSQVDAEISQLEPLFAFREDVPDVFREWKLIVYQYQVIGKSGHDARLVAAMRVHNIGQLLTFNINDFQRFQGIVALSPQQVISTP